MVSVVIPAHNEGENLKKLLPHLLQIGGEDAFEIIISRSNCCTDNVQNDYENVTYVTCEGKGRALQMNSGASVAKGKSLAFLHADVSPPDTFFSDIRSTLSNGFEAGFFSYRFDKSGFFLRVNSYFTATDGIFTGGGDQCLFIEKSIFQQLGKFDEKQVLMEDFEFFKRMKKKGIRYKIIKNDLIVSARKYENNSYVRVNLSNLLLVLLFKMGYPPKKLKSLHNRLLRVPYQNNP